MFLKDYEILDLIDRDGIEGVPQRLQDPYVTESHIQPSSLDLTIGRIFVPNESGEYDDTIDVPGLDEYVLETGQTAVVETAERFKLPDEIAGFGFPPARVSRNGILMTNPGHIDPGYEGKLSFTLVNMGRSKYPLEKGKIICTVLLFKLDRKPARSYRERVGQSGSREMAYQRILRRLSPDFLEINNRAKEVAKRVTDEAEIEIKNAELEIKNAELRLKSDEQKWKRWTVIAPVIAAVLTAIVTLSINLFWFNADLEKDISVLEAKIETLELDKRIGNIETVIGFDDKVRALEERLTNLEQQREP